MMTFRELHEAVGAALPAGVAYCIKVEAWGGLTHRPDNDAPQWSIWRADTHKHFDGSTAEAALDLLRADEQRRPLTEVVVDMPPVAAPYDRHDAQEPAPVEAAPAPAHEEIPF